MALLDSKFLRAYGIVTDKYGIDPLRDQIAPLVAQIKTYHTHEVQQDERGGFDLISKREYGSEDLWWYIAVYNGIALYKDVVEGLVLKIPEYASLLMIIAHAELAPTIVPGTPAAAAPRRITV